jgi:hypothetical protein
MIAEMACCPGFKVSHYLIGPLLFSSFKIRPDLVFAKSVRRFPKTLYYIVAGTRSDRNVGG